MKRANIEIALCVDAFKMSCRLLSGVRWLTFFLAFAIALVVEAKMPAKVEKMACV